MLEEKRDMDGILYVYDQILPDASQERRFVKVLVAPNLEVMGVDCFYRCPMLEKVIAPKLKKIGTGCFDECPKLTNVIAPFLSATGVQFIGGLFVDLKKKRFLNCGDFSHQFVDVLESEIQKDAPLVIEKKGDVRLLKVGRFEVLKEEKGIITGICLPTVEKLPSHSLYENKGVKELILLSAKKIDHNAIYKAKDLQKVVAPQVTDVRFSNFSKCPVLSEVQIPKLFFVEHSCFNDNAELAFLDVPALESVDRGSFCHLPSMQAFYGPKIISIGESSFQHNPNMKTIVLPKLIEMERGMLYRSGVQELYAPLIHNRSQSIKYLKNAKHLIKNKAVLPLNYKNRIKDERQNV